MRIIVIKKIKLLLQSRQKKNLWDLGSEYKLLATYLVVLCRCGILEEWSVVTSSSTASIKISRLRGLPTERRSFTFSIFPRTETYQTLGLIFVDNGLSFMGISIVCSFERLLLPEQRSERTDS